MTKNRKLHIRASTLPNLQSTDYRNNSILFYAQSSQDYSNIPSCIGNGKTKLYVKHIYFNYKRATRSQNK